MSQEIKIIIADDHEIFRKGLISLLKKHDQLKIVAEADNGQELLNVSKFYHPDIVITDIKMPELDGIEATRILNDLYPTTGIIALSMLQDDEVVMKMVRAGAKGYLLKNTTKKELIEAIQVVFYGSTFFSECISRKIGSLLSSPLIRTRSDVDADLNKTEIEIIKMICQEMPSKQIAPALGLSIRTIESYREKIQQKINAKNMVGIAVYALKNKIFKP